MELRLRGTRTRRRALHQLPAQKGRCGPAGDDPHRAWCGLPAQAGGAVTAARLRRWVDQQLAAAGTRYAAALEHDDRDSDNAVTGTLGQAVGTLGARSLNGVVTSMGVVADTGTHVSITPAD